MTKIQRHKRTYIRLGIGQNLKGKLSRVISHFLSSRDDDI